MPRLNSEAKDYPFELLVKLLDDLQDERARLRKGNFAISPLPFHYRRAGRCEVEAALDRNSATWAELKDLLELLCGDGLDYLDYRVEMVVIAFRLYDMELVGARADEDYAVAEAEEEIEWREIRWLPTIPSTQWSPLIEPLGELPIADDWEPFEATRDYHPVNTPLWACCFPS